PWVTPILARKPPRRKRSVGGEMARPWPAWRSSPRSREDVDHRDPARLDTRDDDRDILAASEDLVRLVAVPARLGQDLDLAFDQIDDPVDRDPPHGIHASHGHPMGRQD